VAAAACRLHRMRPRPSDTASATSGRAQDVPPRHRPATYEQLYRAWASPVLAEQHGTTVGTQLLMGRSPTIVSDAAATTRCSSD